jgi:hypothetical protein
MASLPRHAGGDLISDDCPVPEQLLTRLMHAAESSVIEIAETLTEQQRTSLALFCYSRAHLHEIGLTIAQTCDQHSLVQAAGVLGRVVFMQSRERAAVAEAPLRGRKKISLAQPAAPPMPMMDFDDEDAVEPAAEQRDSPSI